MSASFAVRVIAVVVGFVACIALVVIPHQTTGWLSLGVMLLGLSGLLFLLYLYNRRYR